MLPGKERRVKADEGRVICEKCEGAKLHGNCRVCCCMFADFTEPKSDSRHSSLIFTPMEGTRLREVAISGKTRGYQ